MYNRYIPHSDGTYQRNRLPDGIPRKAVTAQVPQAAPLPPVQPEEPCNPLPPKVPEPRPEPRKPPQRYPRPQKREQDNSVSGFLKQLLPNNFDTADLLVVLLLLLMSGEGTEDQNTALLTLALYLFL